MGRGSGSRVRAARIGVLLALGLSCAGSAPWPRVAAESPGEAPGADVTVHESAVFRLQRGDGAHTLEQRVQRASHALAEAVESSQPEPVSVRSYGERVAVVVGATPIVELSAEDAALGGDGSLEAYAAGIASRVRGALARERQRSRIANSVFSASLVVFFGLVTLYLVRKLNQLGARARRVLVEHPQRVPALRLKRLEVLGPAAVRSALLLVVIVGHGLGAFGLAYTWLVLSLSLFAGTRPYVERLTGFVLSPVSALVTRVASALPLFVVVVIAGALIGVVARVAELFLASVARGETRLRWLEPELAQATSTLVRAGLWIFALVFAGPVITGDANGSLSRSGAIVLCALALASTPLLASVMAGVALAFSRSVRAGDHVEYGGRCGCVRELGVLALILEGEDGSTIRVPHARSLWHPTRILRARDLGPARERDEAGA